MCRTHRLMKHFTTVVYSEFKFCTRHSCTMQLYRFYLTFSRPYNINYNRLFYRQHAICRQRTSHLRRWISHAHLLSPKWVWARCNESAARDKSPAFVHWIKLIASANSWSPSLFCFLFSLPEMGHLFSFIQPLSRRHETEARNKISKTLENNQIWIQFDLYERSHGLFVVNLTFDNINWTFMRVVNKTEYIFYCSIQ